MPALRPHFSILSNFPNPNTLIILQTINSYLSKLLEAMIVLEDSNILEFVNSFSSANGSFRISPYPLLNQIKAKLKYIHI